MLLYSVNIILQNVSFPKVLDLYDICTEELKKSLDLGREFERKQREEEDNKRLEGKDVEMKNEESKEETKEQQMVGLARKEAEKEKEMKISDETLYRPHGLGLDTGHY